MTTLFDNLGIADRGWSQKLGGVRYDLMGHTFGFLMETGAGVVAEAGFSARAAELLRTLAHAMDDGMLEVCCAARTSELVACFRRRTQERERHAGHRDADNLSEHAARAAVPYQPMGLGPVLRLDTSERPEEVFRRAREWVAVQLGGTVTCVAEGIGETRRRVDYTRATAS